MHELRLTQGGKEAHCQLMMPCTSMYSSVYGSIHSSPDSVITGLYNTPVYISTHAHPYCCTCHFTAARRNTILQKELVSRSPGPGGSDFVSIAIYSTCIPSCPRTCSSFLDQDPVSTRQHSTSDLLSESDNVTLTLH